MQILGISAGNRFSQKTFADSLQLPYPLLSDFPALQVIRQYGVLHPSGVFAERAFFLVDQQGVVRGRWRGEGAEVFSTEEILKTAQALTGKR